MPTDQPNPAERHSPASPDRHGTPSVEEVVERLERVRPAVVAGARLWIPDLAGHTIGPYTIQRIVGRGAFGIVYQAHDNQLGRDVALKIPRPEVLFDEEKLRRFEGEAATAATLDHPSIIPVYEADLTGPTPYIASAYCAGPDLGKWLESQGSSIPIEQAARFVIKLAEAVHHAHRQGVLHRDLKPSNVMLEQRRGVGMGGSQLEHFEPRLTDFGLAKLIEGGQQDTRSSLMLGTPLYMAPEQIDRTIGDVGVQTDVYALGAIFYELLLGTPTFKDSSHVDLLLAIREREVTPPSRVRPSVSPTLEAICLKALEKRPQSRYSTASELADDLGRYLRGEPTVARPLALPGRAVKWIGTNPLAASLMAVIATSIVGLLLGALWHNQRLSEQLAVSHRLRIESVESANRHRRARYVADMQLAHQAISNGRFSEARSRLEKYHPGSDGAPVSDFAWHLLSDQLKHTIVEFDCDEPLTALATVDSLQASIAGGKDGTLRFFDTATGAQLAVADAHVGSVNAIAVVAGGTTLVSGGDDGFLCVWDISSLRDNSTIELVARRKAHDGDLLCAAVAPDGTMIATGGNDNKLYLWDLDQLEPAGELVGHEDWIRSLDFSPDGLSLASASDDATVRRWDIETKKEVQRFVGHEQYALCVKHHPTLPLLVSGGKDRSIRFWDISTGEQRQQLTVFNGWVRSLSFSTDGNRLAVAADDPRVICLERDNSGQYDEAGVMFTDRARNLGASFAHSDDQIVSTGTNGASAWSPNRDLSGEKLHVARGVPVQLVGHPNDSEVTLVTNYLAININTSNGDVREYSWRSRCVAASRSGNLIAAIDFDGTKSQDFTRVAVTNEKCENRRILSMGSGRAFGVDVSSSGEFVAAAAPNGLIRVWKGPSFDDATIVRSPIESDYDALYIDEMGGRLYLHPDNGLTVTILDVATSECLAEVPDVKRILDRSPDGRLLAMSRPDYSVAIYDTLSGHVINEIPSHADEVDGACFSPTEPIVASITNKGEMSLWALDSGELLIHFQTEYLGNVNDGACLAFTSDGRTLVVAGFKRDGDGFGYSEVRAWRVR